MSERLTRSRSLPDLRTLEHLQANDGKGAAAATPRPRVRPVFVQIARAALRRALGAPSEGRQRANSLPLASGRPDSREQELGALLQLEPLGRVTPQPRPGSVPNEAKQAPPAMLVHSDSQPLPIDEELPDQDLLDAIFGHAEAVSPRARDDKVGTPRSGWDGKFSFAQAAPGQAAQPPQLGASMEPVAEEDGLDFGESERRIAELHAAAAGIAAESKGEHPRVSPGGSASPVKSDFVAPRRPRSEAQTPRNRQSPATPGAGAPAAKSLGQRFLALFAQRQKDKVCRELAELTINERDLRRRTELAAAAPGLFQLLDTPGPELARFIDRCKGEHMGGELQFVRDVGALLVSPARGLDQALALARRAAAEDGDANISYELRKEVAALLPTQADGKSSRERPQVANVVAVLAKIRNNLVTTMLIEGYMRHTKHEREMAEHAEAARAERAAAAAALASRRPG